MGLRPACSRIIYDYTHLPVMASEKPLLSLPPGFYDPGTLMAQQHSALLCPHSAACLTSGGSGPYLRAVYRVLFENTDQLAADCPVDGVLTWLPHTHSFSIGEAGWSVCV